MNFAMYAMRAAKFGWRFNVVKLNGRKYISDRAQMHVCIVESGKYKLTVRIDDLCVFIGECSYRFCRADRNYFTVCNGNRFALAGDEAIVRTFALMMIRSALSVPKTRET
jgi:hypothetical protein